MWTKRHLRSVGATIEGGTRTSLSLTSRAACARSEPVRVHRWPSRVRWGEVGSGGAVAPPLCFDTRRRGVLAKTCASSTRSAAGLGAGASARGGSAASARELLIRGRSFCCRVVCIADRCATGARCRHCKHPRHHGSHGPTNDALYRSGWVSSQARSAEHTNGIGVYPHPFVEHGRMWLGLA